MIIRNITFTFVVTLLAAGTMACGERTSPDPSPVPEAQEITDPSPEVFGAHAVHYTAQMTTRLPAEVARSLDISRGSDRAMLNITVLQRGDADDREPVKAEVEVTATNLIGQLSNISMRELHDGESIYYVGEFTVANEEIVTFDVSVRPEGVETAHEFSFQQQFYTD